MHQTREGHTPSLVLYNSLITTTSFINYASVHTSMCTGGIHVCSHFHTIVSEVRINHGCSAAKKNNFQSTWEVPCHGSEGCCINQSTYVLMPRWSLLAPNFLNIILSNHLRIKKIKPSYCNTSMLATCIIAGLLF